MEKIYFAKNIKFLREREKLTQENLAQNLSMTRVKLNALETGHTKTPTMDILIGYSNYFKISIDSLLKIDLTLLGEVKLRALQAGNDVFIKGSNLRVLAISVSPNSRENVTMVTKVGQAGYFNGYDDPEYIGTLPTFNIPTIPDNRTCRMFPIEGRSMHPFPEEMFVLADYVNDWTMLANGELCVVVLKSVQQILFKAVMRVEGTDNFILRSYNADFTDILLNADEILELWKYRSYMTNIAPEAEMDLAVQVRQLRDEFRDFVNAKIRRNE